MLETTDPRKQLAAKDLATQTAAARDLARMGDWSDVPTLLNLAKTHRRTGMRMGAAAAAADIVHRCRTGAAKDGLSEERTAYLLDWVKGMDPSAIPSALMILASLPGKATIARLGRLMRDPRSDVRQAAAVSIRRMALSHCDVDSTELRAAMKQWFAHRKLTNDARAHLVRIVGDLGWTELMTEVHDAAALGGACSQAAAVAVERAEARDDTSTWRGVWVDDGLDVLEQDEHERPGGWLLIGANKLCQNRGRSTNWTCKGRQIQSAALPSSARLVWAPRVGKPDPIRAVQILGRTWFLLDGPDTIKWVDQHADGLTKGHGTAIDAVCTTLADDTSDAARRAMGVAYIATGHAQRGLDELEHQLASKKVNHELHYWVGKAHHTLDNPAERDAAFERYLEKAMEHPGRRAHAKKSLNRS